MPKFTLLLSFKRRYARTHTHTHTHLHQHAPSHTLSSMHVHGQHTRTNSFSPTLVFQFRWFSNNKIYDQIRLILRLLSHKTSNSFEQTFTKELRSSQGVDRLRCYLIRKQCGIMLTTKKQNKALRHDFRDKATYHTLDSSRLYVVGMTINTLLVSSKEKSSEILVAVRS